jgi:signal transduction histidine kinase
MASSDTQVKKNVKKRWRIPMRFKILIGVLVLVTAAVSTITFTMANIFHTDKRAYIKDLTSLIALQTAQETQVVLIAYREQLKAFSRLMYNRELEQDKKANLLKGMFEDFPDFIAVTLYEEGRGDVTVFDALQLENAGLTREQYDNYRSEIPLPMDKIKEGSVYVENSTLSDQLPTLTLAIQEVIPETDKVAVVAGLIKLDKLLNIAGKSNIFETFVVDGKGMALAHSDPKMVKDRKTVDWIPNLTGLLQGQSAGTTLEYQYQQQDYVGGFSALSFGGLLAGVQIPATAAYLTAKDLFNDLLMVSLALLAGAAFIGLIWSYRITSPIKRLAEATTEVGQGKFDVQVKATSRDEIGALAESFNHMAFELKEREHALQAAQGQLIQSEKMAAFGQLGAGIAHEVKNPLAGILGYAQLSLRKAEKGSSIYTNLELIEKETKRCKTIIENLMKFARQEKAIFEPANINRVVEDAIAIVDHQLSINQVKIVKNLAPDLPMIMASANQIQQVLMNLMINAQQALDGEPGRVGIMTSNRQGKWVEIIVKDTGPGMSDEVKAHIFEPFFTTKPAGKGTGLGMSVSYGIIRDHQGEIRVVSEPGKGATFIIILPIANEGIRDGEFTHNEVEN